ncbi:unnamed protein product [Dibothriocephalus latus]|uniref:G domain-containing protein n=1 Tax=Dibothriocephalus latus TaxID=60516 RepID=A0A3P7NE42_DIBLA|nr:unnamed protein product [Dibothriocephalus latus]
MQKYVFIFINYSLENKSKRLTCHKRYKIIKKVREHHRKVKREQRTNPQKFRRKDPGIPNSLPFKEEVLKHVIETKEREKQRLIELMKRARNLQNVQKTEPQKKKPVEHNFTKQFNSVVNLVPQSVLRQWLSYFRKWYTVMPFKANIQKQSTNRSIVKGKIPNRSDLSLKQGLGVDGLMSLLGNISRSCVGKLTVGVIGIPNAGKSAVINTLVRRRVAPSSCVPGLTKECQVFKLDNKVKLIDSPGIVLSKSEDPSELALRNCTKIIVQYSIGDFASTTDFLCQLAQRMGKLKKGGVPDSRGAARIIISDWIT